jgi:K+:H+ antiporter subunit KhtT
MAATGSEPRPTSLPGVGERLDVRDEAGRPVQVVRRRSGHVEIHHTEGVVVLGPEVAPVVGAFAAGRYTLAPELAERMGDVLGGLVFDWVRVPRGAAAAGRSIEQLQIRRRTGVSVIAVLRGHLPVVDPDPSTVLDVGDDLVVACRGEQREALERLLRTG